MEKNMRVRAEIDLDAVAFNMESMRQKISPETKITAVIKADAYGHGAVEIAHLIEDYPYVWGFAVAAAEEGMELRRNGIRKPILTLGYTFPECWPDMIDYDIRFTVFDYGTAEEISRLAGTLGKKAFVHIALDTGMSRIGFADTDASVEEVKKIAALPHLVIEVVGVRSRMELDLLDFLDLLRLARLLGLYGLLILELPIVHDFAHGGSCVRRDLDKIETALIGQTLGVANLHDAEHVSRRIKNTHLRCADLEIYASELCDKSPLLFGLVLMVCIVS